MNKSLSGIALIVVGVLLFIFGGQFYGDIGWLGFFCFIGGIIKLAFPKQLQRINESLKNKGNTISYILLLVTVIVVVIYYFQ